MIKTCQGTRFGLIRHASTVWNLEKRIQGHSDSALTADGEKDAGRWGQGLRAYPWDRILSSDTGRARQTATIINSFLQVPLTTDARLREQDWGQWTAKTLAEVQMLVPLILAEQQKAGWGFGPPGGEDRRQVWERTQRALMEAAEKWRGETILVVTHEGPIKCLIYRLCGRKFLASEPPLLNASHLHWIVFDGQSLRIEAINALAL
ncbi:MAG: histidine phosphatase family protein [Desulfobacterales bacterium]|nr:MAG: histidine phosphatase family protein [Desulfobacterales bacterium]